MYREFLYSDITLAVLIPFCILIVLKVGMAIIAKVKRDEKGAQSNTALRTSCAK